MTTGFEQAGVGVRTTGMVTRCRNTCPTPSFGTTPCAGDGLSNGVVIHPGVSQD